MAAQIIVSIEHQTLELIDDGNVVRSYRVSTAKNGPGERSGSQCTPRGQHVIDEKFGAGCAPDTIFVARRNTGNVFKEPPAGAKRKDWVLTRIMWLKGCEPGKNLGGNVDTRNRYIYIHGCPDSSPMGVPLSHGCIRMRNAEIIELFELVAVGTDVLITA